MFQCFLVGEVTVNGGGELDGALDSCVVRVKNSLKHVIMVEGFVLRGLEVLTVLNLHLRHTFIIWCGTIFSNFNYFLGETCVLVLEEYRMGVYSFERGNVMGMKIRFNGETLVDHVVEDERVFFLHVTDSTGFYFDRGHWSPGDIVLGRNNVEFNNNGTPHQMVEYVDGEKVSLDSWDKVMASDSYKEIHEKRSFVHGYIIYERVTRRIVTKTAFEDSERSENSLRIVEEWYATADDIVFKRDYWADRQAILDERLAELARKDAENEAAKDAVTPSEVVEEPEAPALPRRRRERARGRWWDSNVLFKG